jgi:hypothetical protein
MIGQERLDASVWNELPAQRGSVQELTIRLAVSPHP